MEKFKLTPKKGFDFTVKIKRNEHYWQKLFRDLMAKDVFAPLLIMMGFLDIAMDESCPAVASPYAQRYAWIGEFMADAEREEIEAAAMATGLYSQGLNDFVLIALANDSRTAEYAPILKEILSHDYMRTMLLPQVIKLCDSSIESVK